MRQAQVIEWGQLTLFAGRTTICGNTLLLMGIVTTHNSGCLHTGISSIGCSIKSIFSGHF